MVTLENVKTILDKYLLTFPEEFSQFDILKKQITANEDIVSRKNFHGHVTASGLIISQKRRVLLIFHNKLQRYLQPGGHIESEDENLFDVAQREVEEETMLNNITIHEWCQKNEIPILVNTHNIPENKSKNEDTHYHHDFMFVFYTKEEDVLLDYNEVSDFKWIKIEEAMKDNSNVSQALRKLEKIGIV